jgi:hypothetical protein
LNDYVVKQFVAKHYGGIGFCWNSAADNAKVVWERKPNRAFRLNRFRVFSVFHRCCSYPDWHYYATVNCRFGEVLPTHFLKTLDTCSYENVGDNAPAHPQEFLNHCDPAIDDDVLVGNFTPGSDGVTL